jgi:hypothetical protein
MSLFPGKKTRMVQLLDLDSETQPLGTDHHDTEWGPRCYVTMPYDVPMYMRIMRLVNTQVNGRKSHTGEQTGWTIELDAYTFGVKLWVRIGKDGTFKVFTEDSEGRELVANYE